MCAKPAGLGIRRSRLDVHAQGPGAPERARGTSENPRRDDRMSARDSSSTGFLTVREEMKFEIGILHDRINALVSAEAFLIISFTMSLTYSNDHRSGRLFWVAPLLASVGLLLALLAWPGVNRSFEIIAEWNLMLAEALEAARTDPSFVWRPSLGNISDAREQTGHRRAMLFSRFRTAGVRHRLDLPRDHRPDRLARTGVAWVVSSRRRSSRRRPAFARGPVRSARDRLSPARHGLAVRPACGLFLNGSGHLARHQGTRHANHPGARTARIVPPRDEPAWRGCPQMREHLPPHRRRDRMENPGFALPLLRTPGRGSARVALPLSGPRPDPRVFLHASDLTCVGPAHLMFAGIRDARRLDEADWTCIIAARNGGCMGANRRTALACCHSVLSTLTR